MNKTLLITGAILAIAFLVTGSIGQNAYAGFTVGCNVTPTTHQVTLLQGESIDVNTSVACNTNSLPSNITPDSSDCETDVSNTFGAVLLVINTNFISETYIGTHAITNNGLVVPGTHSCDIVWTVDGTSLTTTQTIEITVPSAQIQTDDLIGEVEDLNLTGNVDKRLLNKLNSVQMKLDDGNLNNDLASCSKLDNFKDEVTNLENNGTVTTEQADSLRDGADNLKSAIGCP